MVGDEVVKWNTFLTNLIKFALRLENHGFVYSNGKVRQLEMDDNND